MSKKHTTSESYHLRLPHDLKRRIQVFADTTNRSFNNACETLLYDAVYAWELEQERMMNAGDDD